MFSAGVVLPHNDSRQHMARQSTHLLQEFSWEIFIHPPYIPDLAPSDFHLFLHLNKFLSGQSQSFQDDRDECHTVVPTSNSTRQSSMTQEYKSWSHGMTNLSISEVNMLKNSSTLAVSVPINIFVKLGFVFLNSPSETYFVDALLIILSRSVAR